MRKRKLSIEPVVLRSGASVQGIEALVVGSNGQDKDARFYTFPAPPGAVALVGIPEDGSLPSHDAIAGHADPCAPVHPPTVLRDEKLAGVCPEALQMLREGSAEADPDPPLPEGLGAAFEGLDKLRPVGAAHVPGPRTPCISDYADYELPVDTPNRYLEVVNGHARDKQLRFVETTHSYYITLADGTEQKTNGSVTYMAHQYEPEFERDKAIAAVMGSRRWPRLGYCAEQTHIGTLNEIKHVRELRYLDANGETLATLAIDLRRARKTEVYTVGRPFTAGEIKASWDIRGLRARNRGTEIHYQIELFLNRDTPRTDMAEIGTFCQFAREIMIPLGMVAYRTEWRVFCEHANVAGSVDCVVAMPDGTHGIIDWKRSTKVRSDIVATGSPYDKYMAAPLDHLDSTAVSGYALQLNLYKYILERHYGMTISCLMLVQVGPDDPFYTFVPELPLEAEFLMAYRRAEFMAGRPDHPRWVREREDAKNALRRARPWSDLITQRGIDVAAWVDGACDFCEQAVSPPVDPATLFHL